MRWNDDLGCYVSSYYAPLTADAIARRQEELRNHHGCYDCINNDTCWEASRLGLPCEDWEADDERSCVSADRDRGARETVMARVADAAHMGSLDVTEKTYRVSHKKDGRPYKMNKKAKSKHSFHHHIAVFSDGVFVAVMGTTEIVQTYGIRPNSLRSKMAHGTPWHGYHFIDLDDWPCGVCPGCILECEKPWPCSEAVRYFAHRYRHHAGVKPIDITGRRVNGTARM